MGLKVRATVQKMVPVEVLELKTSGPLSEGSVAAGFKCSACGHKLGGRTFGTAWIRDSKGDRSMRLCQDCAVDAQDQG